MKQSGLQYSHDNIAMFTQILQYSHDNMHISTIFLQYERPDQKGGWKCNILMRIMQ